MEFHVGKLLLRNKQGFYTVLLTSLGVFEIVSP